MSSTYHCNNDENIVQSHIVRYYYSCPKTREDGDESYGIKNDGQIDEDRSLIDGIVVIWFRPTLGY